MLYIVHIAVEIDHHDPWRAWMCDVHVPDVMATGCFAHGTIARDESADTSSHVAYRIIYRALGAADFARYEAQYGPGLRAEHTARFGAVTIARRELLPVVWAERN